jgi:hypothetical protein
MCSSLLGNSYCALLFSTDLPNRCYRHGGVSCAFDSVLLCYALLRLLGGHLLQTVSESSSEAAVTWISTFLSQLGEIERHVDEYSSTAVSCPRCSAQCQFMAILKQWTQHRAVILVHWLILGALATSLLDAYLSTVVLTFVFNPEFRNEFLTRWAMYVWSNIVAAFAWPLLTRKSKNLFCVYAHCLKRHNCYLKKCWMWNVCFDFLYNFVWKSSHSRKHFCEIS